MSLPRPLSSLTPPTVVVAALAAAAFAGVALAGTAPPAPVALPGTAGGAVGFDDLQFSKELGRVVVPAGATRKIHLVDPASRAVSTTLALPGAASALAAPRSARGTGHGDGTTSAVVAHGALFAADRSARTLVVVDVASGALLATAALSAGPDYVRVVDRAGEVWVTEPHGKRIEVFSIRRGPPAAGASGAPVAGLARAAVIEVPDGPESLVVDEARGRAYTNAWRARTFALDLHKRAVVDTWQNGCGGARGAALDDAGGALLVACTDGRVVALDVATGEVRGTLHTPVHDVDIIAFAPALRHVYVPGDGAMTIASVAKDGAMAALATVPTAPGAHCVVADDHAQAWVCDPSHGRLLVVSD